MLLKMQRSPFSFYRIFRKKNVRNQQWLRTGKSNKILSYDSGKKYQ